MSLQPADLVSIGHFLVTLALLVEVNLVRGGSLLCADSVAVDAIARYTIYSEDFTMLSAGVPSSTATINQILGMVGPRLALDLGHVWTHSDRLERNLNVKFDSSRMFCLIGLSGLMSERRDAGVEPQCSETGDRYLLKLFRDYVFHRNYLVLLSVFPLAFDLTYINSYLSHAPPASTSAPYATIN